MEWENGQTELEERMSVELISVLVAVLAIGATLAGVILTSNRGLRKDMREDMKQGESRLREDIGKLETRLDEKINGSESRLDERIERLESRLRDDIKQLGDRVGRMEHSQAKLEGLLEGLREAISGRAAAS